MTGVAQLLLRVFTISPRQMRVLYPVSFAVVVAGGVMFGLYVRWMLGLGV